MHELEKEYERASSQLESNTTARALENQEKKLKHYEQSIYTLKECKHYQKTLLSECYAVHMAGHPICVQTLLAKGRTASIKASKKRCWGLLGK